MSDIPSLEDLLKKGVHFGHKESKWHPNMAKYIYTSRNGVHILDLAQTQELLKQAAEFVRDISSQGKHVLVIGTKKSIKGAVKKHTEEVQCPNVTERWLGGTITNFKSIYGLVQKLESLEKQEQDKDYEAKYNKKERLDFTEEMNRLKKMIGGIRMLTNTPDALFVTDVRSDKTAIKEAQRKGIPVIAIVDSNVDPTGIDYPIPANDDSVKSVDLITAIICQAIAAGRKEMKSTPAVKTETSKKDEAKEEASSENVDSEK